MTVFYDMINILTCVLQFDKPLGDIHTDVYTIFLEHPKIDHYRRISKTPKNPNGEDLYEGLDLANDTHPEQLSLTKLNLLTDTHPDD